MVVTRLNRISNEGRSLSLYRRGRDSDVFLPADKFTKQG